jgi:CheY-like chemotaxis protein
MKGGIMAQSKKSGTIILVAEDDSDDRLLLKRALEDNGFSGVLQFVNDGVELMDYLRCSKCGKSAKAGPRPDIILLDLNMPRKDGREAIQDIRADADLNGITIVAMTGSEPQNDTEICHRLGADRLMSKPDGYSMWVQLMGEVLGLLNGSSLTAS